MVKHMFFLLFFVTISQFLKIVIDQIFFFCISVIKWQKLCYPILFDEQFSKYSTTMNKKNNYDTRSTLIEIESFYRPNDDLVGQICSPESNYPLAQIGTLN